MALVTRYSKNPNHARNDVPYVVATDHNAGVIKHNSENIMLFRSHKLNGRSILGLARSNDCFNFKVEQRPFLTS